MKRVTTLIAGLVLLFAASAQAAGSKDEDAIKARVAEFSALFSKGDAKAVAAFFADDGTLVNPVGMKGKGPAEIEKIIATDIATILKDTKMELTVVQYRAVGKDAAWVELEHSVNGAKAPDGKAMPTLTFHVPALLVKKGKNWMIAEARPYAYLPTPPAPVAAKPAAGSAPVAAKAAPPPAAPAAPAAPAKK
jgi:uncharacterized protein (TIGR02246 family)